MQWDINDTDDTNNKKGQKIIISNRLKEEENKYLERERTPRSPKKTITTQTTTMKWFLESDHVEAIYTLQNAWKTWQWRKIKHLYDYKFTLKRSK